jgi:hypothetical protein
MLARPDAGHFVTRNLSGREAARDGRPGPSGVARTLWSRSDVELQDARMAHTSVWRAPPARLYEVV